MNKLQDLLGTTARLYVTKYTDFGIYLASGDDPEFEVLLPKKQIPEGTEKGTILDVFLYKDSEDRLISTTATPFVQLHEVALLKVTDVTDIGAFLDWGLMKDLFLPFKEQTYKVKIDDEVLVTLYIDKSERLCASMKIYDYLSSDSGYQKGDIVTGRIYEEIDAFGIFVAVDDKYSALLPHNEISRELHIGEKIEARIKDITEEGKLTLSLQKQVSVQMSEDADRIFARLEISDGFLPFHDKTSPEIIKREFQMSKNAFKRAIGRLLKEKKIEITDQGIKQRGLK